MAHKKGLGSSRNGRDSQSKRLGCKMFGGQKVKAIGKRNSTLERIINQLVHREN